MNTYIYVHIYIYIYIYAHRYISFTPIHSLMKYLCMHVYIHVYRHTKQGHASERPLSPKRSVVKTLCVIRFHYEGTHVYAHVYIRMHTRIIQAHASGGSPHMSVVAGNIVRDEVQQ